MNHEDNDPVPVTGNGSLITAEIFDAMVNDINLILGNLRAHWVNDISILHSEIGRLNRQVRELEGRNARH